MPNPGDKLTMVIIADRLEQAAHTLRRLPKVTVQGFTSNWPSTVSEFHESYGYNEATVRLGPPSARHISEMDEALRWMLFLNEDPEYIRKLVWLRANRVRWKRIQSRFPHSLAKLHTDWRNAIYTILVGLQVYREASPNLLATEYDEQRVADTNRRERKFAVHKTA